MDNHFEAEERLYRAVYPPSYSEMYWKKNGKLSSAAFLDPHGLSVDRGDFRESKDVVKDMKKRFSGCIVSFSVADCYEVNAKVKYKPSKENIYHTEVHGSSTIALSKSQRLHLAQVASEEYMEK